jgi:hypothetical protein
MSLERKPPSRDLDDPQRAGGVAEDGGGAREGVMRAALHRRLLQRKAQRDGVEDHAPAGGPGKLPGDVQASFEGALGASLDHVRIHADDPGASGIGARAYTQGADIHFAPGEYDPRGDKGRDLLGHEVIHTQQQAQGRVAATVQTKGLALNAADDLEAEADHLGSRLARGEPVDMGAGSREAPRGDGPVQRFLYLGADSTDRVKRYEDLPLPYKEKVEGRGDKDAVIVFLRDRIKENELYLRALTPDDLLTKYDEAKDRKSLPIGADRFQAGDKLYGFTGLYGDAKEEKARDRHVAALRHDSRMKDEALTIDQHLFGLGAEKGQEKLNYGQGEQSEKARFGQFLEQNPSKYRENKEGDVVKETSKRTTKVCKAGIQFFTARENKTIHFELLGLDMTRVITDGNGFTDKELRYVYRQYLQKLASQGTDVKLENIKFYLDGHEVPPPWEAEPQLWEKYKLAREQKKVSGKQNDEPEFAWNLDDVPSKKNNSTSSSNKEATSPSSLMSLFTPPMQEKDKDKATSPSSLMSLFTPPTDDAEDGGNKKDDAKKDDAKEDGAKKDGAKKDGEEEFVF